MKAVVFRSYGKPEEVLKLEEVPTPECGENEVLVKIKARSVNPSDLYTIMGLYGVKPKLPAIPGNEAAGVIEEIGKKCKRIFCRRKSYSYYRRSGKPGNMEGIYSRYPLIN